MVRLTPEQGLVALVWSDVIGHHRTYYQPLALALNTPRVLLQSKA